MILNWQPSFKYLAPDSWAIWSMHCIEKVSARVKYSIFAVRKRKNQKHILQQWKKHTVFEITLVDLFQVFLTIRTEFVTYTVTGICNYVIAGSSLPFFFGQRRKKKLSKNESPEKLLKLSDKMACLSYFCIPVDLTMYHCGGRGSVSLWKGLQ